MNIQEYSLKIKATLNSGVESQKNSRDKLFTAFAIILVAFAGFGLGRLSTEGHLNTPVRIIGPAIIPNSKDDQKVIAPALIIGDESLKNYYLLNCQEVQSIATANRISFKTIAVAEKAGFTAGQCHTSINQ